MAQKQDMKEVSIAVKRLVKKDGISTRGRWCSQCFIHFVDAVANICSQMGNAGYKYGRDYIWAYNGYTEDMDECVTLFVKDDKMKTWIHLNAKCDYHIKHLNDGTVKLSKVAK
jgi:hypothetical protein